MKKIKALVYDSKMYTKESLENGIAMVHQELNQCLDRNVMDNLFLGRYPTNKFGVIDEKKMYDEYLRFLVIE